MRTGRGRHDDDKNKVMYHKPNEQCFPFHPLLQMQVPLRQIPFSRHLGLHVGSWHLAPVHPSEQMHSVPRHVP